MEEAFTIMVTTQGAMGLGEILDLPDADRVWLHQRCARHHEEIEKEAEKAKRAARSAGRGARGRRR
jgi:hypothetical protein